MSQVHDKQTDALAIMPSKIDVPDELVDVKVVKNIAAILADLDPVETLTRNNGKVLLFET